MKDEKQRYVFPEPMLQAAFALALEASTITEAFDDEEPQATPEERLTKALRCYLGLGAFALKVLNETPDQLRIDEEGLSFRLASDGRLFCYFDSPKPQS